MPHTDAIDIWALRNELRMTQADFARRFGIPLQVVRQWEQGRRRPVHAARVLLRIIATAPEVVDAALAA